MTTYTDDGEVENDFVLFQLKATDRLKRTSDRSAVVFRLDRGDLESWLVETFPVILVVYDARAGLAYWLYLQAYFEEKNGLPVKSGKSVTVHLPIANVLNRIRFAISPPRRRRCRLRRKE